MSMDLASQVFKTEPEYFIAGANFPIETAVKVASADIGAHAPVKLSTDGKLEKVSSGDETTNLYGITAEDAKKDKEAVVYLTGEFFADGLALEMSVTADKLEIPFRNLGIYLVGVKKNNPLVGPDHAPGPVIVQEQGQALKGIGGNKKVSDLIAANVKIEWTEKTGKVTGDIHKVTGWTEFSQSESEGHYFPMSLGEAYKGKKITCTGSKTKTAEDTDWILKVDTCKSFKFEEGEQESKTEICTLDFKSANLENT